MRTLAPIHIWWDWMMQNYTVNCRRCSELPRSMGWEQCLVWGLGHLSLKHPQWPSAQLDTDGSGK